MNQNEYHIQSQIIRNFIIFVDNKLQNKAQSNSYMSNLTNIKSNLLNDEATNQMYADQNYQSPLNYSNTSNTSKYALQVQSNFTIDYPSLTYEDIQSSTTAMRDMLKKLSHLLDFKLHQNYGMMGVTVIKPETDLQKIISTLKQEKEANTKLIQTQISEIKNIQIIDQEMASNKRVQVQAQKLRQMRKIKKQMVQSEKQSRFNRGEISKAGQYLARDLDSEKLNFRLNKIKQDTQYMLVKQKNLILQQSILDGKVKEMQEKNQQMKIIFQQNVRIAQMKNLTVSANKSYMTKINKKEGLKKQFQQKKKNLEVLTYNTKHNTFIHFKEIEEIKKQMSSTLQKLNNAEQKINQLKAEIQQKIEKNKIEEKLDQSMIIKNIQTLLKKKNERLTSQLNFESSQVQLELSGNIMSESVLLKPNFKIKPFLLNSSKGNKKSSILDRLDSSLDLKQKKPNIFIRKSHSKQKTNANSKKLILNQEESQQYQVRNSKKQIQISPITLKRKLSQEQGLREKIYKKKDRKVEEEIQFQFDD